MKIQKLSLNSIKNVLSRSELRQITAGSGGGGCATGGHCFDANYPNNPPCCHGCVTIGIGEDNHYCQ